MPYEKLLNEAYQCSIDIYEEPMKPRIKGLYADNVIWINKDIDTSIEKACVLAEEIGHYHTSVGDILDQSVTQNVKQEKQARKWAWNYLVTPDQLVHAFNEGCRSKYEIANMLEVTEAFLEEALNFYKEKYGNEVRVDGDHYLLFDPLAVYKTF